MNCKERILRIASELGLTRKDYMDALADFAEGKITAKQVTNKKFLEKYHTPSTYKLMGMLSRLMAVGKTKRESIKELKDKYPRCSKAQWDSLERL